MSKSPFIVKAQIDALLGAADAMEGAALEWHKLAGFGGEDGLDAKYKSEALSWCAENLREGAAQMAELAKG